MKTILKSVAIVLSISFVFFAAQLAVAEHAFAADPPTVTFQVTPGIAQAGDNVSFSADIAFSDTDWFGDFDLVIPVDETLLTFAAGSFWSSPGTSVTTTFADGVLTASFSIPEGWYTSGADTVVYSGFSAGVVSTAPEGTVTTTATLANAGTTTAISPASSAGLTIVDPQLVTITKTANPSQVFVGGTITYTITLTNPNTFDFPTTMGYGVRIQDAIDVARVSPNFDVNDPMAGGITITNGIPSNVYFDTDSNVLMFEMGQLPHGTMTIEFSVTLLPTTVVGDVVVNRAWVSMDDPNGMAPADEPVIGQPVEVRTPVVDEHNIVSTDPVPNPLVPSTPSTPTVPSMPTTQTTPSTPTTPSVPTTQSVPTTASPQTGDYRNVFTNVTLLVTGFALASGTSLYWGRKWPMKLRNKLLDQFVI